MKSSMSLVLAATAAALAFAAISIAAGPYDPTAASTQAKLSPAEVKKIQAALPAEAYVKPAKPRKLLVYTESKGYFHDSIPSCAEALLLMGEKTGAYEATLTDDDTGTWTLDNLNKYDGIFMDNTVGDHPKTDQGKKDFVEYIKSGHGLMGTHAAADCNHPWAEYFDMIGGEFAGHPYGRISVKLEDPDNPINAVWGGKGFRIDDEIYTFKPTDARRAQGYGRDKQHILMSIDMEASGLKDTTRKDGDYALAWIKEYGKGRVFYCALGHNRADFWNPTLLKFYLAGIQYALGDLKADATPTAKLTPAPKVVPGPDMKTPTINVR